MYVIILYYPISTNVSAGVITKCMLIQAQQMLSPLLYQVANATANHRYVFPPLFSKKSSSFCIYVVLLSYHTKQSHIHKNCYAYFTMDF